MKTDKTIKITVDEDRFHRQKLIPWWDQERLADARILVLGAGALGNEIVKNLSLLGVGHVRVVDFDDIENSNLSRSVLFREGDEGKQKCEVISDAARCIYPSMDIEGISVDIVFDLGWGWYFDADIIITGLDGREARLAANKACSFTRKPFIDGAIEGVDGVARLFTAWDGPCYECTMSEKDWELIRHRHSCNMLSKDQMLTGHVPTTSTMSSIVAGFQVQQALKYLHSLDFQQGVGLQINGLTFEAYSVEYQRSEECYAHEHCGEVHRMPWSSKGTTISQALDAAAEELGESVSLELRHDIVIKRECMCGFVDEPLTPILKMSKGSGLCPECSSKLNLSLDHSLRNEEKYKEVALNGVGVAEFDILQFKSTSKRWHVLLDGDRPARWTRSK